jgi:ribosomal-protein-alanine N-acetyltransferase
MHPVTGEMFHLETRRFKIRPLAPDDASASYLSWWNDPRIQAGFNLPARGWQLEHARQHIASFDNQTRFHLGIFCKESRDLIGFVALFFHQRNNLALWNILIGEKRFWGRRVAQELAPTLLRVIFEDIGIEKMKAEIHGPNRAAMILNESLGFSREGVLRNEFPTIDGGRADLTYYGLLRDEWIARNR